MANRNNKVIFAKDIRLDKGYKNILSYSESAMLTLVNSKKVFEKDDFSFIRNGEAIEVEASYGNCLKSDYIAFQNPNYSSKWFFAFVDKVEYVSQKCTRIYYTIDELSTWYDYWTQKACFVVREHTNDDSIGANTVPEGLDCGEYQILRKIREPLSHSDYMTCFVVSDLIEDSNGDKNLANVNGEVNTIGGVFSSLHYLAVKTDRMARKLIYAYTKADKKDAIVNVYPVPISCVNINPTTASLATGGNPTNLKAGADDPISPVAIPVYPLYDTYVSESAHDMQQPVALVGNYIPRNKKLYTYPFSYFYATNMAGSDVIYHWEDFPFHTINGNYARTASYKKVIVPSASISAKLFFTEYKNQTEPESSEDNLYNYGINFPKVPICAWTTDYYTNWLTQNGVNMATQIGSAAVGGAITGAGIGGVGGAIAGAIGGIVTPIIGAVSSGINASKLPDQAHGDVNTGDVMFAFTKASISFYYMTIRPEFARILDDVFDRTGYKTNRVKLPNQTGRPYWNYVQIGDHEDIGYSTHEISVPPSSMEVINNAYRSGVTIWHNHDNIGDFSLNNH